jgi:ribosome-interacting GTPase 1
MVLSRVDVERKLTIGVRVGVKYTHRVYLRALYCYNKCDLVSLEECDRRANTFHRLALFP